MKRMLCFILLIGSISPVWAQEDKVVKAAMGAATQSDVALKIAQQVEKTAISRAYANVLSVQITNWVGQPSIRVQQAANGAKYLGGSEQVPALTARILDWEAAAQNLFPDGRYGHKAHMPTLFGAQQESAFYRGLPVRRLDDLKNLVKVVLDKEEFKKFISERNGS